MCKCETGSTSDGGKPINAIEYCEYYCSNSGFCGNGYIYEDEGNDCTGCKIGNKSLIRYLWISIQSLSPSKKYFWYYEFIVR